MYIVIKSFSDLQDPVRVRTVKEGILPLRYRTYRPGDVFPHPDAPLPAQERFAELAGDSNKQGTPLIKWVSDPEPADAGGSAEIAAEEKPEETEGSAEEAAEGKSEAAPVKRKSATRKTGRAKKG